MSPEEIAKLKEEEEAARHRVEGEGGSPRQRHSQEGDGARPHGEPDPAERFQEGHKYGFYTASSHSGDTGMHAHKMYTEQEYREKLAKGEIYGKDRPYIPLSRSPAQLAELERSHETSRPLREENEQQGRLRAEMFRHQHPGAFSEGPVEGPGSEAHRKQQEETRGIRLGEWKEEEGKGEKKGETKKEKRWITRPAAYDHYYY